MAPPVRSGQAQLTDTIFAVSSGRPPAAIAVIRISGPQAFVAVEALAGTLPPPRIASLRALSVNRQILDRALVLVFPGPRSATGEDLAELHCHGGRAVVAAVEGALAVRPGLRRAEPGEFTRRALMHGRIDLMEAEGLADLLEAETEQQRVAAIAAAEGRLSARTRDWLDRIAILSARAEAQIDYAEEDDVAADGNAFATIVRDMAELRSEILAALETPSVERLRDGVQVVIGGPPNAGKSTLLNLLAEREVAIVSPIAGTTRDRIEAPVIRQGMPYVLTDTAGLTGSDDPIERIGVSLAQEAADVADVLIWLGDDPPPRSDALWVHSRSDLPGRDGPCAEHQLAISKHDPTSIDALWTALVDHAQRILTTRSDLPAMRDHQRDRCRQAADRLNVGGDLLLVAEGLAAARRALAALLGCDATEAMLDALFHRFCLGK